MDLYLFAPHSVRKARQEVAHVRLVLECGPACERAVGDVMPNTVGIIALSTCHREYVAAGVNSSLQRCDFCPDSVLDSVLGGAAPVGFDGQVDGARTR